jgi:hypothetical protein
MLPIPTLPFSTGTPSPFPQSSSNGPNWPKIVVGTVAFGILLVGGVAILAIGIGLIAEDPPAGAFIGAGGAVLTALAIEGLYQTWDPLLPSTWPDHLIVPRFNFPGE